MTRPVRPGIYEDLMTATLEAGIKSRTTEGWRVEVRPADATIRPEFLARHVYMLVRRALEAVPGEGDEALFR